MWSDRVAFESLTSKRPSSFVTLTFDDKFLGSRGVDKSEVQNFLKRFRNNLYLKNERKPLVSVPGSIARYNSDDDKFRYFQTSEYGDQTFRKHYHMCVTNFDCYDKQDFEALFNAWRDPETKEPIGILTADSLTPGRIRYAIEYISYETRAQQQAYKALGLSPLFHSMSKGIGKDWIFAHADEIRSTNGYYSNGVLRPLPYYYRDKLGMITKDEYIQRLDLIWQKYNDKLVSVGLDPVNPFDVSGTKARGLFDQFCRDSKRTVLQMAIGNEQKELHLLKRESVKKDRPKVC